MNGVVNHLWQSTLFAAAVAGLVFLCRQNRAAVRYWLWLTASMKFFVPFAVFVWAGSQIQWEVVPVRSLTVAAPWGALQQTVKFDS